jgi:hypothetical protein
MVALRRISMMVAVGIIGVGVACSTTTTTTTDNGDGGSSSSGDAKASSSTSSSSGSSGDAGDTCKAQPLQITEADGGVGACDQCAHANCQAEITACFGDVSHEGCECQAAEDCEQNCFQTCETNANPQQCVKDCVAGTGSPPAGGCAQQHPDGVQRAADFEKCVFGGKCGTGDGGSGVCG